MASERQLDNENNPWWGEHIHRYEEAAAILAANSIVLDLACGTGFGANFLSNKGHVVVGADISETTISECSAKYAGKKLAFEMIDGTKIPYKNGHFDAVISFETIEHTAKFLEMLSEFNRITKKGGLVILSTPNFLINSPSGVVTNPFHTQEWTYGEFEKIINSVFPENKIYGQSYARYDQKNSNTHKIGKRVENLFYRRGFRKFPINIQDSIMKLLIKKPMYPLSDDFKLVLDLSEIKKCKTFFAVCNI
jgi:2-polyprenyl-3-methyl-5-hydroxy-6-metoxy-1,4-benzoquinol methylase